jgi:hypothetical protein
MRILLLIALVLFVFALIAALAGPILAAGWNVWLCAGFLAWILDQLVGSRGTL